MNEAEGSSNNITDVLKALLNSCDEMSTALMATGVIESEGGLLVLLQQVSFGLMDVLRSLEPPSNTVSALFDVNVLFEFYIHETRKGLKFSCQPTETAMSVEGHCHACCWTVFLPVALFFGTLNILNQFAACIYFSIAALQRDMPEGLVLPELVEKISNWDDSGYRAVLSAGSTIESFDTKLPLEVFYYLGTHFFDDTLNNSPLILAEMEQKDLILAYLMSVKIENFSVLEGAEDESLIEMITCRDAIFVLTKDLVGNQKFQLQIDLWCLLFKLDNRKRTYLFYESDAHVEQFLHSTNLDRSFAVPCPKDEIVDITIKELEGIYGSKKSSSESEEHEIVTPIRTCRSCGGDITGMVFWYCLDDRDSEICSGCLMALPNSSPRRLFRAACIGNVHSPDLLVQEKFETVTQCYQCNENIIQGPRWLCSCGSTICSDCIGNPNFYNHHDNTHVLLCQRGSLVESNLNRIPGAQGFVCKGCQLEQPAGSLCWRPEGYDKRLYLCTNCLHIGLPRLQTRFRLKKYYIVIDQDFSTADLAIQHPPSQKSISDPLPGLKMAPDNSELVRTFFKFLYETCDENSELKDLHTLPKLQLTQQKHKLRDSHIPMGSVLFHVMECLYHITKTVLETNLEGDIPAWISRPWGFEIFLIFYFSQTKDFWTQLVTSLETVPIVYSSPAERILFKAPISFSGCNVYFVPFKTARGMIWQKLPRFQEWKISDSEVPSDAVLLFVGHRWARAEHPDPEGKDWCFLSHVCHRLVDICIVGLSIFYETIVGPRPIETFLEYLTPLFDTLFALQLPPLGSEISVEFATAYPIIKAKLWHSVIKAILTATSIEELLVAYKDNAVRNNIREKTLEKIFIWYDFTCIPQEPLEPELIPLWKDSPESLLLEESLIYLSEFQAKMNTVILNFSNDYTNRAWCTAEWLNATNTHASSFQTAVSHAMISVLGDKQQETIRLLLSVPDVTEFGNARTTDLILKKLDLKITCDSDSSSVCRTLWRSVQQKLAHGPFYLMDVTDQLDYTIAFGAGNSVQEALKSLREISSKTSFDQWLARFDGFRREGGLELYRNSADVIHIVLFPGFLDESPAKLQRFKYNLKSLKRVLQQFSTLPRNAQKVVLYFSKKGMPQPDNTRIVAYANNKPKVRALASIIVLGAAGKKPKAK